ncbi:MAG: MerR family transcriptional regulator [Anaerolineae bacterium]|nr:MerR family transcriptional regulator [Anaerolineae bacterium]
MATPSYYSIRQAAQRTGLSAHTLRWYERIGLIDPVERDNFGYRVYTEQLLNWLQFLHVLRSTGMGIEQMQAFVELARQGESTQEEQLEMLKDHRKAIKQQMLSLEGFLEMLESKMKEFSSLEETVS